MKLALFDLDHTLLPMDSADAWSQHVVRVGALDSVHYGARIRHFAETYRNGSFDINDYLAFQMGLLAQFERATLEQWRADFLAQRVFPYIRDEARALIDRHRADGYELVLVTGTHSFVSAPIAEAFGLPNLLALQPEEKDGRFTGRYSGYHTYSLGKLRAVEEFVGARGLTLEQCEDSVFYSDSINDLPLLESVKHPVVVHGDERLRIIAVERGWPQLDLFGPSTA